MKILSKLFVSISLTAVLLFSFTGLLASAYPGYIVESKSLIDRPVLLSNPGYIVESKEVSVLSSYPGYIVE